MTLTPPPAEDTSRRVMSVIEEELARVNTIADAEAVIRRAEHLAASKTEAQAGKRAAAGPASAPAAIELAKERAPTKPAGVADTLVEIAAQAIAPTSEAPAIVEAAQEAIGTDQDAPPNIIAYRPMPDDDQVDIRETAGLQEQQARQKVSHGAQRDGEAFRRRARAVP